MRGLMGKVSRAWLAGGVVLPLLAAGAWCWLYAAVHWPDVAHHPVAFLEPPDPSNRIGPGYPPYRSEPVNGGFEILDRSGRLLVLRGAALEARPEAPPTLGKLRRRGINLVRLEIPWRDLEPRPGHPSRDTLAHVGRLLDEAGRHGVGVLLASPPWKDTARHPRKGLPDWAFRIPPVGTLGEISAGARFLADFLEGVWTPDQLSLQDHLMGAWVTLARTVRNHPSLLGYEVTPGPACPSPPLSWFSVDATACHTALQGFRSRFVATLRAADGKALVFANARPAGTFVDGLVIWAPPPREGVGLAKAKSEMALEHGAPVVFTGSSLTAEILSTRDLDAAWASWLLPEKTVLAATPHPFPERIAGRPVSFEIRPAAAPDTDFRFTFRQGEVTAETFLFMPGGESRWSVKVSDGRVHWSAGDPDVLVWITNPTVHTHTMSARTRSDNDGGH